MEGGLSACETTYLLYRRPLYTSIQPALYRGTRGIPGQSQHASGESNAFRRVLFIATAAVAVGYAVQNNGYLSLCSNQPDDERESTEQRFPHERGIGLVYMATWQWV
jgi:hypothetical protein